MIKKAVIDRFEGDYAVLLIDEGINRLSVLRTSLPKRCREGTWLKIEVEGENILKVEIDREERARRMRRILEKLKRLRRGEHRLES